MRRDTYSGREEYYRERNQRLRSDPALHEKEKARRRRWNARHKDKRIAHKAVENAIARGELIRQPCERCGAPKAFAHHDDYSKPFELRWLCHRDHMARHRELRALTRETA